jgi:hypothetical protein
MRPLAMKTQIGNDTPVFDAEIVSVAADGGHDHVGDELDVVRITNLSDALPVTVSGNHSPRRGPHDRLGDEGAYRFEAFVIDAAFEFVRALEIAGFGIRPEVGSV